MTCLSDLGFIEAVSQVLAMLESVAFLLTLPALIFVTGLLSLGINYLIKPKRRIVNIPRVLFAILQITLFFPKLILYGLLVIWIAAAAFSCVDAIVLGFFIMTWMALGFYHVWEWGYQYIDRMAYRRGWADSVAEEYDSYDDSDWMTPSALQAKAPVKKGVLGRIRVVKKTLAQIEEERMRDAARRAGLVVPVPDAPPKLLAAPKGSPFWARRDPLKGTSFDPKRKK